VPRGRTASGRARATARAQPPAAIPLLRTTDEGRPIRLDGKVLQANNDRWVDPFLAANRPALDRLGLAPEVHTSSGLHMLLRPSGRIGAVPLLTPTSRKVVAGVLVSPRFRWSALGEVLSGVGFAVAPTLGGGALVPGSAREVPSWLIAGPVIRRLETLLARRRSAFIPYREDRAAPRGRVDWGAWARERIPVGRWTALPCEFSDLADDPNLMAAVRWTLARLTDDLRPYSATVPGRLLTERVRTLQYDVGEGAMRRPTSGSAPALDSFLADALEAMGWVADERGLGGARALDGLAWDLEVARVWEAWVRAFARRLAPQLGLRPPGPGEARRPLRWHGSFSSMGSLAPDMGLVGDGRVVWIDAKYKSHLSLLARHGWPGVTELVREAHRADLHQALAYAALIDVERVDTVLMYPSLGDTDVPAPTAVATMAAGRRRVRLVLGAIPFGFKTPSRADAAVRAWRGLLAA
jgi:hypothetical protein